MRQIGFSGMALLLFGIVGGLVLRGQAAGIDKLVEADSLERIATGFRFTEGPVTVMYKRLDNGLTVVWK